MYRNLMHVVVNPTHLSKCSDVNLPHLRFLDYVLPCETIYFGFEFNNFAAHCFLDQMQIMNVKERCTSFVIELIKQVQMRLPENVDILLMLNNFHPFNYKMILRKL